MAEFKATFLKRKDNTLFYSGDDTFVFIVPELYFDKGRKCAIIEGEYINLLGTIDYTILKGSEKDVTKRMKRFFFPSMFYTKPGRIEKAKGLNVNGQPEDYRLLYYTDNNEDEIVSNVKVPQDITNVERLNNLFIKTGHINKSIPYDKLQDYFFESIKINGGSYKISAQLFGAVISELCRDPNNMANPFRLSNTIEKDMKGYKPISIIEVPKYISPYQSLISENWDDAVIGAIMNDNRIASPMEKIMKD
ncbi:MAG: hypothetical protein PHC62_00205 [Candidatus Izemoplasmatales bacterium]|nr:hypothetical protein [Candidatus Izemoplasmatales bacterium]